MTVRTTVLGLVLLVSFSVPFLNGYGQVNPRLSKQNLGFEKAKSLFDLGQYENAQLVIDGITRLPNINGILSRKEQEELKYMEVVCSLVRGEYVAVQDAKHLLQTAETKSISSNLAFNLGHYYFGLARYAEAVDYLEMTDVLLLSNDQNERVQFEKGVSYFSQKKFDNASPYFKSLYQLKNSTYQYDVAYYLGFMSFAERKYSEALQLFLSIKDDVKYATIVPFYLGFIYHEKGEKELALKNGELYLKGGDLAYEKEMLQL
jgi:tetratricopeptide (TPR) repeat protein